MKIFTFLDNNKEEPICIAEIPLVLEVISHIERDTSSTNTNCHSFSFVYDDPSFVDMLLDVDFNPNVTNLVNCLNRNITDINVFCDTGFKISVHIDDTDSTNTECALYCHIFAEIKSNDNKIMKLIPNTTDEYFINFTAKELKSLKSIQPTTERI
ncbi:MAG: hypothetical protein U0M12_05555 [Acutalibacteraceae bacterium]|nr:hypothetical protein [Acutalibacteraceae bacterium]